VVSYLGSYNPHTKTATIDAEKAAQYLENGAQPSDTVARLFQKEGIKLPTWVKLSEPKNRVVRNADKRRSTSPAPAEAPADTPAEPVAEEAAPTEESAEAPAAEAEQSAEAPAVEESAPNESVAAEPEAPAAAEKTETEG
jgi:small subunit ribosomal protein S16